MDFQSPEVNLRKAEVNLRATEVIPRTTEALMDKPEVVPRRPRSRQGGGTGGVWEVRRLDNLRRVAVYREGGVPVSTTTNRLLASVAHSAQNWACHMTLHPLIVS